jgi:hypothetical protein
MSDVNWEDCYEKFPEVSHGQKTGIILTASLKLVHEADVFHAVRRPSGYGWATWEVYKNGTRISSKYGSNLPVASSVIKER